MRNIVFILGAGASRHAGAPLMAEFMPVADDMFQQNASKHEDFQAWRSVTSARKKLTIAHTKAYVDIQNVEAVYGALEMARLFGRLADAKADEIDVMARAMRRVIGRTIEWSMKFRVDAEGRVLPSEPYRRLAEMTQRLVKANHHVDFLTFNYDIALDFALEQAGFEIDYFRPSDRESDGTELLKLHGSVNWCGCTSCGHRWVIHCRNWVRDVLPQHTLAGKTGVAQLAFTDHNTLCTNRECRKPVEPPLIVPPTWNKGHHQDDIANVWRRAANILAKADSIVVIGYSWPRSDEFFHHLYALGTIGETFIRKFLVMDIDAQLEQRFAALLGPQARDNFRFHRCTFEEHAINILGAEFRVAV